MDGRLMMMMRMGSESTGGVEEGWMVDGMTVKSNETEGKEVLEHYTGQSLV